MTESGSKRKVLLHFFLYEMLHAAIMQSALNGRGNNMEVSIHRRMFRKLSGSSYWSANAGPEPRRSEDPYI